MPRKDQSAERRVELIGTVASTFAELGYRRATTAELARRCGIQEPILYRLWPDKRAMFIAALEFVADNSRRIWERAMQTDGERSSAELVLAHEAEHLGEFGLYRILFAGWSETDDAKIRAALQRVYRNFFEFVVARVRDHRHDRAGAELPAVDLTAWSLIGLGTIVSLGRELDLLTPKERGKLFASVGRHLLGR